MVGVVVVVAVVVGVGVVMLTPDRSAAALLELLDMLECDYDSECIASIRATLTEPAEERTGCDGCALPCGGNVPSDCDPPDYELARFAPPAAKPEPSLLMRTLQYEADKEDAAKPEPCATATDCCYQGCPDVGDPGCARANPTAGFDPPVPGSGTCGELLGLRPAEPADPLVAELRSHYLPADGLRAADRIVADDATIATARAHAAAWKRYAKRRRTLEGSTLDALKASREVSEEREGKLNLVVGTAWDLREELRKVREESAATIAAVKCEHERAEIALDRVADLEHLHERELARVAELRELLATAIDVLTLPGHAFARSQWERATLLCGRTNAQMPQGVESRLAERAAEGPSVWCVLDPSGRLDAAYPIAFAARQMASAGWGVVEYVPRSVAETLEKRIAGLSLGLDAALTERDNYHDRLDEFASAVASEDFIGEHSSCNDPWANALQMLTPYEDVERLKATVARERKVKLRLVEAYRGLDKCFADYQERGEHKMCAEALRLSEAERDALRAEVERVREALKVAAVYMDRTCGTHAPECACDGCLAGEALGIWTIERATSAGKGAGK